MVQTSDVKSVSTYLKVQNFVGTAPQMIAIRYVGSMQFENPCGGHVINPVKLNSNYMYHLL
jgi:hypothetical protein